MISSPLRNAYMDDPQGLADCRRAAWAVFNDKAPKGFKLLGSGHYSAVYSVPGRPGLVLKVGGPGGSGACLTNKQVRRSRSAYSGSRCVDVWPEWVRMCAEAGMKPWMPNVYHVEALNDGMYFAVMERLVPDLAGFHELLRNGDIARIEGVVMHLMDERMKCLAGLDVHSGNVMMRGDQFVVTDPILARRYTEGHVAWPLQ